MKNIFHNESLDNININPPIVYPEKTYIIQAKTTDVLLGKDVMNDLEVFHPYDNESYDTTLFNKFTPNCATEGGKIFIKDILTNPICSLECLLKRTECLKSFENQNEYPTHLSNILKDKEADFLWFFTQNESTIDDLLNSIYFSSWILNRLNKNDAVLTSFNIYKIIISPLLGLLSPIIYFVIPFLIIKYKFGNVMKLSFTTYIKLLYKSMVASTNILNVVDNESGALSKLQMVTYLLSFFFYFQGLFNTFNVANTTYSIVKFVSIKVNNAYVYVKACLELSDIYWDTSISPHINSFVNVELPKIDESIKSDLQNYKPFENFSVVSNFGNHMTIYKNFQTDKLLSIVNRAYIIDGIQAIILVKKRYGLSTVTFTKSNIPVIDSKQAWHLCVDKDISIKNDISFKNSIITGPNAGGKSTLIKTMCINVLLAQTCCITASTATIMTPFYFINTQINIPDCKGIESLFEAEMNRCMYTLDVINKNPDKLCLVVMDEIFNSTNMIEAIAGAYSILEKLASYENVMSVITTHFSYLTKLNKHTTFKCHKMNVKIDKETNDIFYPYKISLGVSKQLVALELLKKRGFDESIITNAMRIKNKFVK